MTDIKEYWNDEKIVKRFFDKVDKKEDNECWEWTAYIKRGYGQFSIKNKPILAHRTSFEIYNKRFIQEGLQILHSCDNPKCVNPNHLSEGSHKDNMIDKVNKNRQVKGENHSQSKLTEQQVLEIREKYLTANCSYKQLAKECSCDITTIGRIIRNKIWKHI